MNFRQGVRGVHFADRQERRRLNIRVQCTTTECLTGRQVVCMPVKRQGERKEEGENRSNLDHPSTCTVARRCALVSLVCVPDMGTVMVVKVN